MLNLSNRLARIEKVVGNKPNVPPRHPDCELAVQPDGTMPWKDRALWPVHVAYKLGDMERLDYFLDLTIEEINEMRWFYSPAADNWMHPRKSAADEFKRSKQLPEDIWTKRLESYWEMKYHGIPLDDWEEDAIFCLNNWALREYVHGEIERDVVANLLDWIEGGRNGPK